MKPGKLTFIISLVVIVLISLADNRFFAFSKPYHLSHLLRQAAHYFLFATTGFIGYMNWKDKEKWLRMLWVATYAAGFAGVIAVTAVTYFLPHTATTHKWIIAMADVRSSFIGPLPFMVFWLLSRLVQSMSSGNKV